MTTGKTLLSEGQIKEIIREEFASQGVVLTEEQLEELFGLYGKTKIIKHIMKMDPDGSKLDKMGYDSRPEALKALGKKALKGLASELQAVTGDDDEPDERKGFFQKVKDVYAGIKDIGILDGGAGTLLGGEETFDIEKRNALKGTARKQIEGWLKKLNYEPLLNLYATLGNGTEPGKFPNNEGSEFAGDAESFMIEYEKLVKAFEAKEIDCDRANTAIAVLRALVIYYQDFAMSDKNFYVNEQEEPEQEEKMGAAQGSVSKNFVAAYGNKLPLGLAAAGVAALGVGFAMESEFFQNFLAGFKKIESMPTTSDIKTAINKTELLGNVKPGEGIINVVRRMGGPEMANFGSSGGPSMGALAGSKNGKLILALIQKAMLSKQGPAALQQAIAQNANPAQLFVAGPTSGTAKLGEELFGIDKGRFTDIVSETINKQVSGLTSYPENAVKNAFIEGLGKFLPTLLKLLGMGALLAALTSFAMRQKGKGKMGGSRMSRLKGMVDEMVDVPCGEDEKCPDGSEPPCEDDPPEDPCKDKPGTRWNPETKECEEPPEPPPPPPRECDPETEVLDPKTGKCIKKPKTQTPKAALKLPAIAVLDDDTVSTFRINWRKQDDIDAQADIYAAAEKANIVGRNSSPRSDQVAADSTEKRWGPANLQTFKQIKRRATSSRGEAPYFAIDASIITDLGNKRGKSKDGGLPRAGLGKEKAIRITKDLFKLMLKDEKKVKKAVAMDKLMRLGIEDEKQLQKALAQLIQYGLVDAKEARPKRKKRAPKKKAGAEEEIVTDLDREPNPINESLTLDRWKVLSGIK